MMKGTQYYNYTKQLPVLFSQQTHTHTVTDDSDLEEEGRGKSIVLFFCVTELLYVG